MGERTYRMAGVWGPKNSKFSFSGAWARIEERDATNVAIIVAQSSLSEREVILPHKQALQFAEQIRTAVRRHTAGDDA